MQTDGGASSTLSKKDLLRQRLCKNFHIVSKATLIDQLKQEEAAKLQPLADVKTKRVVPSSTVHLDGTKPEQTKMLEKTTDLPIQQIRKKLSTKANSKLFNNQAVEAVTHTNVQQHTFDQTSERKEQRFGKSNQHKTTRATLKDASLVGTKVKMPENTVLTPIQPISMKLSTNANPKLLKMPDKMLESPSKQIRMKSSTKANPETLETQEKTMESPIKQISTKSSTKANPEILETQEKIMESHIKPIRTNSSMKANPEILETQEKVMELHVKQISTELYTKANSKLVTRQIVEETTQANVQQHAFDQKSKQEQNFGKSNQIKSNTRNTNRSNQNFSEQTELKTTDGSLYVEAAITTLQGNAEWAKIVSGSKVPLEANMAQEVLHVGSLEDKKATKSVVDMPDYKTETAIIVQKEIHGDDEISIASVSTHCHVKAQSKDELRLAQIKDTTKQATTYLYKAIDINENMQMQAMDTLMSETEDRLVSTTIAVSPEEAVDMYAEERIRDYYELGDLEASKTPKLSYYINLKEHSKKLNAKKRFTIFGTKTVGVGYKTTLHVLKPKGYGMLKANYENIKFATLKRKQEEPLPYNVFATSMENYYKTVETAYTIYSDMYVPRSKDKLEFDYNVLQNKLERVLHYNSILILSEVYKKLMLETKKLGRPVLKTKLHNLTVKPSKKMLKANYDLEHQNIMDILIKSCNRIFDIDFKIKEKSSIKIMFDKPFHIGGLLCCLATFIMALTKNLTYQTVAEKLDRYQPQHSYDPILNVVITLLVTSVAIAVLACVYLMIRDIMAYIIRKNYERRRTMPNGPLNELATYDYHLNAGKRFLKEVEEEKRDTELGLIGSQGNILFKPTKVLGILVIVFIICCLGIGEAEAQNKIKVIKPDANRETDLDDDDTRQRRKRPIMPDLTLAQIRDGRMITIGNVTFYPYSLEGKECKSSYVYRGVGRINCEAIDGLMQCETVGTTNITKPCFGTLLKDRIDFNKYFELYDNRECVKQKVSARKMRTKFIGINSYKIYTGGIVLNVCMFKQYTDEIGCYNIENRWVLCKKRDDIYKPINLASQVVTPFVMSRVDMVKPFTPSYNKFIMNADGITGIYGTTINPECITNYKICNNTVCTKAKLEKIPYKSNQVSIPDKYKGPIELVFDNFCGFDMIYDMPTEVTYIFSEDEKEMGTRILTTLKNNALKIVEKMIATVQNHHLYTKSIVKVKETTSEMNELLVDYTAKVERDKLMLIYSDLVEIFEHDISVLKRKNVIDTINFRLRYKKGLPVRIKLPRTTSLTKVISKIDETILRHKECGSVHLTDSFDPQKHTINYMTRQNKDRLLGSELEVSFYRTREQKCFLIKDAVYQNYIVTWVSGTNDCSYSLGDEIITMPHKENEQCAFNFGEYAIKTGEASIRFKFCNVGHNCTHSKYFTVPTCMFSMFGLNYRIILLSGLLSATCKNPIGAMYTSVSLTIAALSIILITLISCMCFKKLCKKTSHTLINRIKYPKLTNAYFEICNRKLPVGPRSLKFNNLIDFVAKVLNNNKDKAGSLKEMHYYAAMLINKVMVKFEHTPHNEIPLYNAPMKAKWARCVSTIGSYLVINEMNPKVPKLARDYRIGLDAIQRAHKTGFLTTGRKNNYALKLMTLLVLVFAMILTNCTITILNTAGASSVTIKEEMVKVGSITKPFVLLSDGSVCISECHRPRYIYDTVTVVNGEYYKKVVCINPTFLPNDIYAKFCAYKWVETLFWVLCAISAVYFIIVTFKCFGTLVINQKKTALIALLGLLTCHVGCSNTTYPNARTMEVVLRPEANWQLTTLLLAAREKECTEVIIGRQRVKVCYLEGIHRYTLTATKYFYRPEYRSYETCTCNYAKSGDKDDTLYKTQKACAVYNGMCGKDYFNDMWDCCNKCPKKLYWKSFWTKGSGDGSLRMCKCTWPQTAYYFYGEELKFPDVKTKDGTPVELITKYVNSKFVLSVNGKNVTIDNYNKFYNFTLNTNYIGSLVKIASSPPTILMPTNVYLYRGKLMTPISTLPMNYRNNPLSFYARYFTQEPCPDGMRPLVDDTKEFPFASKTYGPFWSEAPNKAIVVPPNFDDWFESSEMWRSLAFALSREVKSVKLQKSDVNGFSVDTSLTLNGRKCKTSFVEGTVEYKNKCVPSTVTGGRSWCRTIKQREDELTDWDYCETFKQKDYIVDTYDLLVDASEGWSMFLSLHTKGNVKEELVEVQPTGLTINSTQCVFIESRIVVVYNVKCPKPGTYEIVVDGLECADLRKVCERTDTIEHHKISCGFTTAKNVTITYGVEKIKREVLLKCSLGFNPKDAVHLTNVLRNVTTLNGDSSSFWKFNLSWDLGTFGGRLLAGITSMLSMIAIVVIIVLVLCFVKRGMCCCSGAMPIALRVSGLKTTAGGKADSLTQNVSKSTSNPKSAKQTGAPVVSKKALNPTAKVYVPPPKRALLQKQAAITEEQKQNNTKPQQQSKLPKQQQPQQQVQQVQQIPPPPQYIQPQVYPQNFHPIPFPSVQFGMQEQQQQPQAYGFNYYPQQQQQYYPQQVQQQPQQQYQNTSNTLPRPGTVSDLVAQIDNKQRVNPQKQGKQAKQTKPKQAPKQKQPAEVVHESSLSLSYDKTDLRQFYEEDDNEIILDLLEGSNNPRYKKLKPPPKKKYPVVLKNRPQQTPKIAKVFTHKIPVPAAPTEAFKKENLIKDVVQTLNERVPEYYQRTLDKGKFVITQELLDRFDGKEHIVLIPKLMARWLNRTTFNMKFNVPFSKTQKLTMLGVQLHTFNFDVTYKPEYLIWAKLYILVMLGYKEIFSTDFLNGILLNLPLMTIPNKRLKHFQSMTDTMLNDVKKMNFEAYKFDTTPFDYDKLNKTLPQERRYRMKNGVTLRKLTKIERVTGANSILKCARGKYFSTNTMPMINLYSNVKGVDCKFYTDAGVRHVIVKKALVKNYLKAKGNSRPVVFEKEDDTMHYIDIDKSRFVHGVVEGIDLSKFELMEKNEETLAVQANGMFKMMAAERCEVEILDSDDKHIIVTTPYDYVVKDNMDYLLVKIDGAEKSMAASTAMNAIKAIDKLDALRTIEFLYMPFLKDRTYVLTRGLENTNSKLIPEYKPDDVNLHVKDDYNRFTGYFKIVDVDEQQESIIASVACKTNKTEPAKSSQKVAPKQQQQPNQQMQNKQRVMSVIHFDVDVLDKENIWEDVVEHVFEKYTTRPYKMYFVEHDYTIIYKSAKSKLDITTDLRVRKNRRPGNMGFRLAVYNLIKNKIFQPGPEFEVEKFTHEVLSNASTLDDVTDISKIAELIIKPEGEDFEACTAADYDNEESNSRYGEINNDTQVTADEPDL